MRRAMVASLVGYWERRTPAQTFLYVVGLALVALGLLHLGVFTVDGGPWGARYRGASPSPSGCRSG